MNYEPFTSIKNLTLAHFRHFRHFSSLFTLSHLYICREPSTNQLLFMQNKPNFRKSQMSANLYDTTDYENKSNWTLGENKPNSNPIKPNFQKAQMNINSLITKDYRKKDEFTVRKNKPNSNPISETPKMNVNLYVIEDYENETALRPKKTNPIQTQFLWIPAGVYPARSLPRTEFTPHFDAGMRGCRAGMTMLEDNA